MGTGNDTQRMQTKQQPQSGQKSGKGSARYEDENGRKAQTGKGNPPSSSPGNDPQRLSDKINKSGQPNIGTKEKQSADK